MRARGSAPILAALLGALGCEPTPGTPIVDTGLYTDDGGDDGATWETIPPDTTPPDVGLYDAPAVPDGNCMVYPVGDSAVLSIECDPGTTCDVTSIIPMCARNEDGGVQCGNIRCNSGGGCSPDGQHCVGFADSM